MSKQIQGLVNFLDLYKIYTHTGKLWSFSKRPKKIKIRNKAYFIGFYSAPINGKVQNI